MASLAISGCGDSTAPLPAKPTPSASASVTPAARPTSDPLAPFAAAYAALDRPVTVDFRQAPLPDVLAELSRQAGFPIRLDRQAILNDPEQSTFDDETSFNDMRVTMYVTDLRLESALMLVLRVSDVYLDLRPGEIVFTTLSIARELMYTVAYPIPQALLDPARGMDEVWLGDLLTGSVEGDTWDLYGGVAHLHAGPGVLVVAQTPFAHRGVGRFLDGLRQLGEHRQAWLLNEHLPAPTPCQQAVARPLARALGIDAKGRALADILRELAEIQDVNIVMDLPAWSDAGLTPETIVESSLAGLTFAECLEELLGPLELTAIIEHESLLITTAEEAASSFTARGYAIPPATLDILDDSEHFFTNILARRLDLVSTWDYQGGPASAEFVPGGLLIWQTSDGHQRIDWFLDRLESLTDPLPPADRRPFLEQIVDAALEQPISVSFQNAPLQQAIDEVLGQVGLPPARFTDPEQDDWSRFRQPNVNHPVNLQLEDLPAFVVLELLTADAIVDWQPTDRSIVVDAGLSIHWQRDTRFHRAGDMQ